MSAPQTPHTKYRTLRARPVLENLPDNDVSKDHRISRVKGCDIQALERSTIGVIEVNLTLHILTNLAFNLVIRKWPELVDMEAGISTECGKPRTVRSRGFRGLLFKGVSTGFGRLLYENCFEKRRPNRLFGCPNLRLGSMELVCTLDGICGLCPLKRRFGEIRLLSWNDVIW